MIESALLDLARPRVDVSARQRMGLPDLAQMMRERAAAARALGDDHLDALDRDGSGPLAFSLREPYDERGRPVTVTRR